jgi:hypothetical protein
VTDSVLTSILSGVEASIALALGFSPVSSRVVEYYDGQNARELVLGRKPVVNVVSVHEDIQGFYDQGEDPFPSNSELVAGVDYALQLKGPMHTGILVRLQNKVWPFLRFRGYLRLANSVVSTFGSVKVDYEYGTVPYQKDTVPADISEAAYLEAIARYNTQLNGMGTQNSSSLDNRSVSITPLPYGDMSLNLPLISPVAKILLARRRNIAIY